MKKILIVEDDIVLRENTAEFIKGENFEVFVANDGLEGIQKTLQHLPDLILCDIAMPNMNGYDFYKTIQQIKAIATIPLVFFSAKTQIEDIRAGMQLGADDYITKPFDFFDLLKVIKTRLDKRQRIEQLEDDKFQALINHPTLGFFIYQNGHFINFNETLSSVFGYTKEAFSKVTFGDLIEEETQSKIKLINTIERCLNDNEGSISINFLGTHSIKGKIQFSLLGTVITYRGIPSIIGSFVFDSSFENLKVLKVVPFDYKLTKRELQVLKLVCEGKTTLQISEQLFLSQRTIDTYRTNLLNKTESKNTSELILHAIRNNLVTLL